MIANDIIVEPDQDFRSTLRLIALEPGLRVEPDETTIVIVDDDSKSRTDSGICHLYT
jgi:hypothetical protein